MDTILPKNQCTFRDKPPPRIECSNIVSSRKRPALKNLILSKYSGEIENATKYCDYSVNRQSRRFSNLEELKTKFKSIKGKETS
jgi:hypothetical protein